MIAVESPLPTISLYISAVNEVIDLHAERVAVGIDIRIPPTILLGVYIVALFTTFLVGVQTGYGEKRNYLALDRAGPNPCGGFPTDCRSRSRPGGAVAGVAAAVVRSAAPVERRAVKGELGPPFYLFAIWTISREFPKSEVKNLDKKQNRGRPSSLVE